MRGCAMSSVQEFKNTYDSMDSETFITTLSEEAVFNEVLRSLSDKPTEIIQKADTPAIWDKFLLLLTNSENLAFIQANYPILLAYVPLVNKKLDKNTSNQIWFAILKTVNSV